MCDRRALLLALALLLAHCAWVTPGVGLEISLASDDAPGPLLDATGTPHALEEATLRIARVTLLRCPDASLSIAALVAPGRAHAHEEESAALGPFVVDLLDPAPLALGRITALPGDYCDVRIRVAPAQGAPTLALRGGELAITSELERERVVRLAAPISLDADTRDGELALRVSLANALRRIDPGAPDAIADGSSALAAVLGSMDSRDGRAARAIY